MTIQEAITTGKFFRRKGWRYWALTKDNKIRLFYPGGEWNSVTITVEDIMADDYILKPINEPG